MAIPDDAQRQRLSSDLELLSHTQNLSSLTVKDNKLCKKSVYDRIKEMFPAQKVENREALKLKLKELVQFTTDTHRPWVTKRLFLTKISQLHDPEFIKQLRDEKLLTRELESLMSLELGKLRDEKEKNPTDETAKLARRVARAQLAASLGVSSQANKGKTGTSLVKSTSGATIGVFKPTNTYTPVVARCKNAVKRTFGGQLYFLSHKTKAQAEAEVAAFLLDKHFGFELAPASQMVTIQGKEGAFQVFIKGFKEAKIPLEELEKKDKFTEHEINLFQKLVVYDYLIGNLDRHEENWFVKVVDSEVKELKAIDNANSFLRKNPESAEKIRNQYKWRKLAMAKTPFTEQTKTFVSENISAKQVRKFISEMEKKLPGFLDAKMINNLYMRAAVLRAAVNRPNFFTYELGLYITDVDINKFLGLNLHS